MTAGSLFSGVGGFDLGFERAGFEIKWQVEIDPFCRAVLAKHWPDVRRYEDVQTVGEDLETVDAIVGGFPCQDLSSAGTRVGIDGARSRLWREFIRVVAVKRPRCVVLENVHHAWRRWVPVLRCALWEFGYASLPIRLRACDFGAWHERSRVFLVAHIDPSILRLESWRRGWPFWPESPLFADADPQGRGEAGTLSSREEQSWRDTARCDSDDVDDVRELQPQGRVGDEWRRSVYGAGWATEPDVLRVVYGVPSRLDGRRMAARIGALGNALIPEEAEFIARQILHAEGLTARPEVTP